jgi:SAM-dependent methyltransferase
MKIAALIVSRNRPDLVQALVEQLRQRVRIPCDVFVVECGTELDKLTPHTSAWYPDPDFRGKCYAHNVALQLAQLKARYDYYWVLMNDLVFGGEGDPVATLVETLENESRMAILSPTNVDGGYPASEPVAGGDWRAVTTCDYLGFMMRASALEECGFLNPDFKYCWGAIHELAYRLNSKGWFVAYSDRVSYRHLGGSTYGAKGTNTISRAEYQRNAKRFAFDYFREQYGDNWDELFTAAAEPWHPQGDTFRKHKRLWSTAFTAEELAERGFTDGEPLAGGPSPQQATAQRAARLLPDERAGLVKLHLGCGPEKRAGWVNVDTQAELQPDIVSSVESLPMVSGASADVIEACHLFEHLTWNQARRALREWARILKPGGELFLELPDLESCIRILGKHRDKGGFDLGLIGIYGYPPAIEKQGVPQIHKWGWTRRALMDELREAGFTKVEFGAITQTWRPAAKVGRDMRLRAVRAGVAHAERHVQERATIDTTDTAGERLHLFAWPDWSSRAEIELLLRDFAPTLVDLPNAGLVLRFDPASDGPRENVLTLLADAHRRLLGEDAALDVHFIETELTAGEWEGLGQNITAVAELPSSAGPSRRAVVRALGAPPAVDAQAWLERVARRGGATSAHGAERESGLRARIEALNPWFYPLRIGSIDVQAGVGSPVTHEFLVNHTHRRASLLVDEVARRCELRGKSVLELACNCGYWSSRYAALGAESVVGLEGREQYLQQAELYWGAGQFLPRERFTFLRGNVAERSDWAQLAALGPFDFTLVAGILYHVPNYREVLRWASALTREALVIDTRVVHGEEALVEEPGELRFNAIEATRRKVVPNLRKLVAALEELGFAAEILPVGFPEAVGVENVDSFVQQNRVAIFARRVRVTSKREQAAVLSA